MHELGLLATAVTHQMYRSLWLLTGIGEIRAAGEPERDRGAVTLEQVLWFVAAGVSVAVIAGILWTQIKDRADDPVTPPTAP